MSHRPHVTIRVSSEYDERFGKWWFCARVARTDGRGHYPDVWRRDERRAVGVAQAQVLDDIADTARTEGYVPCREIPSFRVAEGGAP